MERGTAVAGTCCADARGLAITPTLCSTASIDCGSDAYIATLAGGIIGLTAISVRAIVACITETLLFGRTGHGGAEFLVEINSHADTVVS